MGSVVYSVIGMLVHCKYNRQPDQWPINKWNTQKRCVQDKYNKFPQIHIRFSKTRRYQYEYCPNCGVYQESLESCFNHLPCSFSIWVSNANKQIKNYHPNTQAECWQETIRHIHFLFTIPRFTKMVLLKILIHFNSQDFAFTNFEKKLQSEEESAMIQLSKQILSNDKWTWKLSISVLRGIASQCARANMVVIQKCNKE